MSDAWPFGDLRMFGYEMIMADPPWAFETYSEAGQGKSPSAHYETMSTEAICALPVNQLARGDAVLWLWATFPMLPAALEVMRAWGFSYKTGGTWAKRTAHGRRQFGTGYTLRSACEPFLIGTVGSPITTNAVRNFIDARAREHSRKPDAAYFAAARLMPKAWRCELFSRETRPCWDTWGLEAGKFDQPGGAGPLQKEPTPCSSGPDCQTSSPAMF